MRYLAVFVVLGLMGCGSRVIETPVTDGGTDTAAASDSTSTDSAKADTAPFVCIDDKGKMPTALKACTRDADCSQASRMVDCCGSMMMVGVRADVALAFGECERERQKGLPLCDCIAQPLSAEDGSPIPADGAANVRCDMGVCLTFTR